MRADGVFGLVRRASSEAPGASWTPALLVLPALLVIAGLLVAPLVHLLGFSFHRAVPGRMALEPGLTLVNYARLVTDGYYLGIMGRTVALSLIATLVCLIMGFPLAYFLWRAPVRWKGVFTLLVVAPLLISIVVRSYGWMVILGDSGVFNGLLIWIGLIDEPVEIMFTTTAVLIGLVHVQFAFMVLSILAALERIDPSLIEAAATLGATRLRAALEIVAPLALPGIVAGTTLVFSLCMTAFVTPTLMGGSGTRVMTTLVYHQFVTVFNWPLGAAVAALLFVLCLGIVFAFMRTVGRSARRMEA